MDRLNQYRVFMPIAGMGGFIKAANALDLPRASVSAALQQLETGMGARLLQRTTRQVQLTSEGRQLLERVLPLLSEAGDVEHLFQTRQFQVSGRLNVDAPSRIARRQHSRRLVAFAEGFEALVGRHLEPRIPAVNPRG